MELFTGRKTSCDDQKTMSSRKILALTTTLSLTLLLTISPRQAVANVTGDELGYESIVNQLNREMEGPAPRVQTKRSAFDPFSEVMFHAGLGYAGLNQVITLSDGTNLHLNQRGMQVSFGIDLFSRNWLAEGTARSFGQSDELGTKASVQEFELKVVYHDRSGTGAAGYHLGAGLSGRYLNLQSRSGEQVTYSTPMGVATAGLDFFMSEKVSLGFDLNARDALIAESPDKGSYDATLRLDFHL